MTQQYEARRPSVIDGVTPLQAQAWQQENNALKIKAEGFPTYANYHRELALSLRREDLHNKIGVLFDRSDRQNAILDGKPLPIEEIPVFVSTPNYNQGRDYGDEVDYSLILQ